MNNPRYSVFITSVPPQPNGVVAFNQGGITYSRPSYTDEYFRATMPEINISATGSSYTEALTNVLNIATASTFNDPGNVSHSRTRYW
jgi:hypothetical protein